MFVLLLAFAVSLLATLAVLRASSFHIQHTADADFDGPQKFHARVVPRIGGVGIVLGVAVTLLWGRFWEGGLVMLCALPTFLAGLVEDLTKTQTPRRRLFFTAVSAFLGVWIAGAVITKTDLPVLDSIVFYSVGATVITMFVVTGVANAVNIIDGFNGLASMCVTLMLAVLAYVAYAVGDQLIMNLALAGMGGILGFFVWNFPGGRIFLGDGGAYFLGFWVAELGILLTHRNEIVSPLFPLMLCMYPVFETVFSIYRKKYVKGISPSEPDAGHLHQLIYKRLVRVGIGDNSPRLKNRRNSMTSPYLWGLCVLTLLPAILWWNSSPVLGFYIVIYSLIYIGFYRRLVRFKAPKWLVVKK